MPAPVTYWRWLSPNLIVLVTAVSVFHWSIEGDSPPIKIFDRNAALTEGTQIINYQISEDTKWCLLCGISAGGAPGVGRPHPARAHGGPRSVPGARPDHQSFIFPTVHRTMHFMLLK